MDIKNLAQGCLAGAFVGDSAGAGLEFLGHRPDDAELDDAFAMTGGGVFRVAPGQVADDGELALALARALVGDQRTGLWGKPPRADHPVPELPSQERAAVPWAL